MDISFRTRRLEKTLNFKGEMRKAFGDRAARTIAIRLAVLKNARVLSQVPTTPPDRCHQLSGDRDEQFAVDLLHPRRLIFEVSNDPPPRRPDGGIDTDRVTAITIIEVTDYH